MYTRHQIELELNEEIEKSLQLSTEKFGEDQDEEKDDQNSFLHNSNVSMLLSSSASSSPTFSSSSMASSKIISSYSALNDVATKLNNARSLILQQETQLKFMRMEVNKKNDLHQKLKTELEDLKKLPKPASPPSSFTEIQVLAGHEDYGSIPFQMTCTLSAAVFFILMLLL